MKKKDEEGSSSKNNVMIKNSFVLYCNISNFGPKVNIFKMQKTIEWNFTTTMELLLLITYLKCIDHQPA